MAVLGVSQDGSRGAIPEFQPDDFNKIRTSQLQATVCSEIQSLMIKSIEQDRLFDQNLTRLSEALCCEFAQTKTLEEEVKKLGHEIERAKECMKEDSTKSLQNQIDKLYEKCEVISRQSAEFYKQTNNK